MELIEKQIITTSVVVGTYNGEKYILEQLNSILNQSVLPNEIIISDDGSTDRTIELIDCFIKDNKLNNCLFLKNKNQGITTNFQSALDKVTGDIVFLCDQDDIWNSTKIEVILNEFRANPNLSCIISSINYINAEGNRLRIHTALSCSKSHFVDFSELLVVCSYLGMSAAFKKDVYKERNLNLWNKTTHDWSLFIEAFFKGDIFFLGKTLQSYRIHSSNASQLPNSSLYIKRVSLIKRQIDILQNTIQHPKLNYKQREVIKKYIEYLNFRKQMIDESKVFNLACNIKTTKKYGYSLKSYIADILAALPRRG